VSLRGPDVLRAGSLPAVPWKNGGGATTEIARYPRGDAAPTFAWRVSVARIVCDGPFSSYPGIDRTLAVVSGEGLSLAIDGGAPAMLSAVSQPLAFAGDLPVHARLTAGPIVALNVMTRRERVHHAVLPITQAIEHRFAADVGAAVLFAPAGSVDVDGPDGGTSARLGPGDAAVFEGAAGRAIGIRPIDGSRLWLVVLRVPSVQAGAG
jgi:uncharacterized protein